MASMATLLGSIVPISDFSRGKASQTFARLETDKAIVVMKNNRPAAVIASPDEYVRLTEIEENYVLLTEALQRMEERDPAEDASFAEVLSSLGISEEDLKASEEAEIE